MNSGLLEDVCNFLIVSLTYSTAATQTSFFRTSSQTPMTLPSPSSPSSPTGEEEEDDACCVAVTQPVLFLKVVFFSVFPSVVKAGTELTWKYSDDTQWKQEVPCLCSSDACQGHFVIAENLCDVWCVQGGHWDVAALLLRTHKAKSVTVCEHTVTFPSVHPLSVSRRYCTERQQPSTSADGSEPVKSHLPLACGRRL